MIVWIVHRFDSSIDKVFLQKEIALHYWEYIRREKDVFSYVEGYEVEDEKSKSIQKN